MFNNNELITKAQFFAPVIGRVLIAAMFVMAGFEKISNYAGVQGWMEATGVPDFFLIPTIMLEIGAGLAVIVGWNTRLAALALAGFTLTTAFLFHFDLADQMQTLLLNKNIAIAGGLLFLVAYGPGAYSLDNRKAS